MWLSYKCIKNECIKNKRIKNECIKIVTRTLTSGIWRSSLIWTETLCLVWLTICLLFWTCLLSATISWSKLRRRFSPVPGGPFANDSKSWRSMNIPLGGFRFVLVRVCRVKVGSDGRFVFMVPVFFQNEWQVLHNNPFSLLWNWLVAVVQQFSQRAFFPSTLGSIASSLIFSSPISSSDTPSDPPSDPSSLFASSFNFRAWRSIRLVLDLVFFHE